MLAAASSGTSVYTPTSAPPLSAMSKALQLTESLRLLGAVLSLLRLTLDLLGRQPSGTEPSAGLFRRLCSLLEFLEDVREMRSDFLAAGGATGGGGGAGGGDTGGVGGRGGGGGGGKGGMFGCVRSLSILEIVLRPCREKGRKNRPPVLTVTLRRMRPLCRRFFCDELRVAAYSLVRYILHRTSCVNPWQR